MSVEAKKRISQELGVADLNDALYFPRFFEVETVNACNAICRMCTISQWQNRKSYLMSDQIWEKFINEIKDYSDWIDRVNVSRDGEPLLDKRLEDKIRDLKKIGIGCVTFATNASILDEERAYALLDSGLDDIMFSIDGFSKKTYEKIRKGLKFEEVIENCINFINIRNAMDYKTTVRVRMVLQDKNIRELKSWFEYWNPILRKGDRIYAKPAHSWGNQLKGYRVITKNIKKKNYTNKPCISPWSTMVIKVNGDIPLCPVDFKCLFFMGNISKSTINKIWNSNVFNMIRDKLISGKRNDINLCKSCYLWDRSTVIERIPR